jgi:hypothetical protein
MKKLLTFALLFYYFLPVYATHLKGGEIQVSAVAGKTLTYDIVITIYADVALGLRAFNEQKSILVCTGDGNSNSAPRINGGGEDIGNGLIKGVYKLTHTYASLQDFYRVSITINNRAPDLKNINRSEMFPFYVETWFSPRIVNTTPVLTNSLTNATAKVRQKFTYNPKAIDAEGDSLAYRLTIVRAGDDCGKGGVLIESFKQPNDLKKEGTFKIDSRTGDVVWNAPTEMGNYVFAFVVEEWRKGVKISETIRDMEVNVKEGDGTGSSIPPYEPAVNSFIGSLALSNEGDYEENILSVFPNPTQHQIVADINTPKPETATFQLFDTSGRMIEQQFSNQNATQHHHVFNVQTAPNGTLILKVEVGGKMIVRKVVKQ